MNRIIITFIVVAAFFVAGCQVNPQAQKQVDHTAQQEVAENIEILNYWDDDRDPQRRIAAIRLGIHAHPDAVQAINSRLITDHDPKVRAACAWAAGRIKDPRSLPILIEAAKDSDPAVRKEATLALASFDDAQAVETLKNIAETGNTSDAATAVRALGTKSDALLVPSLKDHGQPALSGESKKIFVDATVGNDENEGTQAAPFLTLGKAISQIRAGVGDTVLATSGKKKIPFREKLELGPAQSGQPGNPTVIRNWPKKPAPMIYASEPVILAPGDDKIATAVIGQKVLCVFVSNKKKTLVLDPVDALEKLTEGSFFYDADKKELVVLAPKGGFKKAKIEACVRDDAISVRKADYVQIIGLTAAFAQDTGIDFTDSMHGLVSNCTVRDCDRHGLFFYYSPYGTVTGSEVSRCRFQGISIRSSPHTIVHKAFAHHNEHDGILFLYDSDGCSVSSSKLTYNGRAIGFITGSNFGRVFDTILKDNKTGVVFDEQSSGNYIPASTNP